MSKLSLRSTIICCLFLGLFGCSNDAGDGQALYGGAELNSSSNGSSFGFSSSNTAQNYGSNSNASQASTRLLGSYPHQNQRNVALKVEPTLFIDGPPSGLKIELRAKANNRSVAFKVLSQDDQILRIRPSKLEPLSEYYISVESKSDPTDQNRIYFHTSPDNKADRQPALIYTDIADETLLVIESSSFHFAFNSNIDPESLYKAQVSLRSGSDNIEVTLSVDDNLVTALPNRLLRPMQNYTISIAGLKTIWGRDVPSISRAFYVNDYVDSSDPNAKPPSLKIANNPDSFASLNSAVTGRERTSLDSNFSVQLADPTLFEKTNPLVISSGSRISGSSIALLLNGAVPTGQSTGSFDFVMLSDAIGSIRTNPYDSNRESALVTMVMDLGFSVDNHEINSMFSQSMLGVKLAGLARIIRGGLEITLSGATQLMALDGTMIDVNIFFSITAIDKAVEIVADNIGPRIVSTQPPKGGDSHRLDDRLTVMFSEAIDPRTVVDHVSVSQGGMKLETRTVVTGSLVHIYPLSKWPGSAILNLNVGAVKDTEDNPFSQLYVGEFQTAADVVNNSSPMTLLSVFPGPPCITDTAQLDIDRNILGTCFFDGPVFEIPDIYQDEALRLEFSGAVDLQSLRLATQCGQSSAMAIEKLSSGSDGRCDSIVGGRLDVSDNRVRFVPDGGWEPNTHYRLRLNAGGDISCNADELCGANQLPLNITPEFGNAGGGGALITVFKAVEAQPLTTPLPFKLLNSTDTNGDGVVGSGEVPQFGSSLEASIDLCSDDRCAATMTASGLPVCSAPGAVSLEAGYSCNADPQRTQLGAEGSIFEIKLLNSKFYIDSAFYARLHPVKRGHAVYGDYVPVFLSSMNLPATELLMSLKVFGGDLLPIKTRKTHMLVLPSENPEAPGTQGIIYRNSDGVLWFSLPVDVYYSAPEMIIPTNGKHDLVNSKLQLVLESPVLFDNKGNISVALKNTSNSKLTVGITQTILGLVDGELELDFPPASVRLTLFSSAITQNTEILQ